MNYTSKTRNSSIEVLRIVSILFVTMMHVMALLNYNGAIMCNKVLLHLVNAIGNTGVTCFVLISGYYGVHFNFRKLTSLFFATLVFGCGYFAIKGVYHGQFKLVVHAFNILSNYSLWFVICYMILVFLSDYLNKFAEVLTKKEFRTMITGGFVILCVVPMLFFTSGNGFLIVQGGKNLTYFLFLYMVGRYISLHQCRWKSNTELLFTFVTSSLIVFSLNFTFSYIFGRKFLLFASDCNPFIFISGVSLFYLFKSFYYQIKMIDFVAKSTLVVYLLQSSLREIVDSFGFHLASRSEDLQFVLYFFIEVVVVYLIAILLDKTVGRMIPLFSSVIERYYMVCSARHAKRNSLD